MALNDLERRIFDASVQAQPHYEEMTGGWWLWHGAESFLQNFIAARLCMKDYVYVDASPTKIKAEKGKSRGRPTNIRRKRFDLVVWWRNSNRERAVIEVKRGISATTTYGDREKIRTFLSHKTTHSRCGYIVFYTEAKGKNAIATIERRFDLAASHKKTNLLASTISNSENGDEKGWRWGMSLIKVSS